MGATDAVQRRPAGMRGPSELARAARVVGTGHWRAAGVAGTGHRRLGSLTGPQDPATGGGRGDQRGLRSCGNSLFF